MRCSLGLGQHHNATQVASCRAVLVVLYRNRRGIVGQPTLERLNRVIKPELQLVGICLGCVKAPGSTMRVDAALGQQRHPAQPGVVT